jgi:hypothetical protein
MGVIIGQTDPLTGDFYTTWAKLRSPILGQQDTGGLTPGSYSTHSYQYPAGEGFTTSYGSPLRFDMRYDSTTWPSGFWRPTFRFYDSGPGVPVPGWYAVMDSSFPTLTDEDIAELTGETVVASGTIGTFTIASSLFFNVGQLIQAGPGFTPPYPVEQPILSVGKLAAF